MSGSGALLVTGGAGFIGCNFVRYWLQQGGAALVNLDKLTYAGNGNNLADFDADPRYRHVRGDIGDRSLVTGLLETHRPHAVVNFAAETHVDRSIAAPQAFVETNIVGTFELLEATKNYWQSLPEPTRSSFRLLHVSTDEVYGSLSADAPPFTEQHRYEPRSPYSASKAAADHLVMAYHHTYGLPVLLTNCSNNYGPFQHPEKLIPLVISRALAGQSLPVYGDGNQRRDWLFVADHCAALGRVLERGVPGRCYNIGGNAEVANIDLVRMLCDRLDACCPAAQGVSYGDLIRFVPDRPGHDRRYAMDTTRMAQELQWWPATSLAEGIAATVDWYLDNRDWLERVAGAEHQSWLKQNYAAR